MAVKTYSLRLDGDTNLTANFKVREFKCNDGSDEILIDLDLVKILQQIRDYFGKSITITSAYRTPTYNKKVGGATGSEHTKGKAADIWISGIDPLTVAQYAQYLGTANGIGWYPPGYGSFTHIDVGTRKYWWEQGSSSVSSFGGQDKFKEVEKDMTEEQTRALILEVLKGQSNSAPSWDTKGEFEAAVKAGITDGTRADGYATRAEVAIMVNRARA